MASVLNMHVAFWAMNGFIPEWCRLASLALDVPAFFLISGLLSRRLAAQTAIRTAGQRALRLYATYLVVVVLGTILVQILGTSDGLLARGEILSTLLIRPNLNAWLPFIGFPGSIWFLRVYLLLTPLLVLISVLPTRSLVAIGVLLVAAWGALVSHPMGGLDPSVPFHGGFVVVGALIARWIALGMRGRWVLMTGACFSVVATTAWFGWIGIPDPDAAKFPPTMGYLMVVTPMLFPFLLLVVAEHSGLSIPENLMTSFLVWCGKNVFWFYLVQGFVASIPFLWVPAIGSLSGVMVLLAYLGVFLWNCLGTAIIVFLVDVASRLAGRMRERGFGNREGSVDA